LLTDMTNLHRNLQSSLSTTRSLSDGFTQGVLSLEGNC